MDARSERVPRTRLVILTAQCILIASIIGVETAFYSKMLSDPNADPLTISHHVLRTLIAFLALCDLTSPPKMIWRAIKRAWASISSLGWFDPDSEQGHEKDQ